MVPAPVPVLPFLRLFDMTWSVGHQLCIRSMFA